jgi:Zn-dependent protease
MNEAEASPEDHPALAPLGDAALEAGHQRRSRSPSRRVLEFALALALSAAALVKLGAAIASFPLLLAAAGLHEVGHLAGSRWFGHRDAHAFLPGSAASGVARWKEGAVLLLGPAPGLLLAVALLAGGLRDQSAPLHALAMSLLVFKGLHLLPLPPLDGGRLFRMLLSARRRAIEPGLAAPPPSWGATTALLGAWTASVLALCVGLGLLGLAAPARWAEHQSKAGRFAILMPRAPRVIAVAGTTLEQANQGPERFYQVRWTDGALRPAHPGEVLSDAPVQAAGVGGHELRLRRPGGGVAVVRVLRDGERGFEIMAIAPREEPETQRFLDSFRLLR